MRNETAKKPKKKKTPETTTTTKKALEHDQQKRQRRKGFFWVYFFVFAQNILREKGIQLRFESRNSSCVANMCWKGVPNKWCLA